IAAPIAAVGPEGSGAARLSEPDRPPGEGLGAPDPVGVPAGAVAPPQAPARAGSVPPGVARHRRAVDPRLVQIAVGGREAEPVVVGVEAGGAAAEQDALVPEGEAPVVARREPERVDRLVNRDAGSVADL